MTRSEQFNASWVFFVLAVVFVVHLTGIGGAYVFDDVSVSSDNSLDDLMAARWIGNGNRAVVRGMFALQFATLGKSAAASHLVNIVVHVINTLLVYWGAAAALRWAFPSWPDFKASQVALTIALLWGVHPLSTAAVVYIVQRFESVATMFFLLSLGCYLTACSPQRSAEDEVSSNANIVWLALCVLFGGLGYASKEITAGLPIVLLAAERTLLGGSNRSLARRVVPWILVLPIVFGAWKIAPSLTKHDDRFGTAGYDLVGVDPLAYMTSQPIVYLQYLRLTFWPTGQVLDYGWLPMTDPKWIAIGSVCWIILFGLCGYGIWKKRLFGFPLASVLAILAPTTFIPLTDLIFEHRFYLPLAFVIGSLVTFLATRRQMSAWSNESLFKAALVLAVPLSLCSVLRNLDYRDETTLARTESRRAPDNPRNLYNLFSFDESLSERSRIGLLRQAVAMSEKRGYFYPGTNYKWRRELADQYFLRGDLEQAEKLYEKTVKESHDTLQRVEIQWCLALIAATQGDNRRAEEMFRNALSEDTPIRNEIEKTYDTFRRRASPQ